MIVFDLSCCANHLFEAWFRSSADFHEQVESGLVCCPHCGSGDVTKAPMAPSVPMKANQRPEAKSAKVEQITESLSYTGGDSLPPKVQEALGKLAEAQAKALKGSTWVGKDFAETSRDMHYGEKKPAIIHGEATPKEAKALIDEGIAVAPLPFPVTPPDDVN